jgi:membrane protein YdbS with pleckstrin-like domain
MRRTFKQLAPASRHNRRVDTEGSASPDRARVAEDGRDVEISYRWRSAWHVPVLLVAMGAAVLCDGWLVSMLVDASPIGFAILLVPIAVGFFVIWSAIAHLFNRTRIRIDGDQLHVRHGPVWWLPSRRVAVADIRAIEMDTVRYRSSPTRYHLFACLWNGRRVRLVRVAGEHEARYLWATLRRFRGTDS